MKKNISRILGLVILAAAVFSACAPYAAMQNNPTDKTAQFTQTMQTDAQNAKSGDGLPVVTQTPLPTPTAYDARATELVIADLEAQADKARAEQALAEAQATKAAGDTLNQIALNQAEIDKAESNARISVAYANQAVDEKVKLAEQERLLIEANALAKQAAIAEMWAWGGLLIIVCVSAGILWICIAAGVRIIRSATAAQEYAEETGEPAHDVNELAPKPFTHPTAMKSSLDDYPCTDEEFKVWALAMLDAGKAGQNNWTDAKSPFTTTSYPTFLFWAEEKKKFINVAAGTAKTLNQDGINYCTNWCKRRGIPVPEREGQQ